MVFSSALEAVGVTFKYPEGSVALQDVSFQAQARKFTALLASNGSGKTTLIKVLVKLLQPQRGAVLLAGRDIRSYSESELYQQVGLVFQNPTDQLFGATVSEDVAFGPRNLGLAEAEVQDRVSDALETMAVAPLRHRAIHHLSFGEQKRVAIAGILAMKPSILILDEPTAGLDPAGESMMMTLLNQLNRVHGKTVILATHSVDMLPLFADRIYLLNRGSVLKEGAAAEIFCDQEMIDRAGLRLPYISSLLDELRRLDGVPINGMPLTLGEARKQLLRLIPEDLILGVKRDEMNRGKY
jgi:cobalt/nickel transport system ATP-binding protein